MTMETSTRVKDVIPDTGGEIDLDVGVRKVLPSGSQVLSSVTYGTAAWTRAARVTVLLENGSEKSYFLKIAKYKPALTVVPVAQGQFEDAPVPTYFFLMEFLDISTGPGEPEVLCKELADLHARSQSPTGKFGFSTITFQGPFRQDTTWGDSWAKYFGRLLRMFLGYEMDANGPSLDGKYEAEFNIL
ncbi:hypothetical protein AC579_3911 [Pseudocercospora musae]|uniref:Protein-ribulosamine 3-kinase n=1 Tax=Pseudocercospora musae TaxID=113226 RepID=A0A139HZT6_9PEZI|nr:hypothetical protein AC579_3911 [Pseudocercospora musae]